MPNTGPNPISEYISYDNFGWSLLTSLQLVTMDYWESIFNSVSKFSMYYFTYRAATNTWQARNRALFVLVTQEKERPCDEQNLVTQSFVSFS